MPAISAAATVASKGLAMLGPAGVAASAALGVAVEGIKAFVATVNAFVERGRELAGYNAGLASASARADVTKLKSDINEADRLGPQFARLIDNQARAEATLKEILIPIKNFILNVLNGVLEAGMNALDGMLAALQGILEGVRAIPGVGAVAQDMLDEVKRIRKAIHNDADANGADLLGPLLDQIEKMLPAPGGGAVRAPVGGLPPILARVG